MATEMANPAAKGAEKPSAQKDEKFQALTSQAKGFVKT